MAGGYINGGFNIGRSMFPVPFGAFSPAAADYIKRLDSAGVRVARYDKANAALIDRLVSNGGNFWPASGAFNAMAGYLYPGNGANLIPLKDGHDAGTLNAFVTGDWNAVTGLKGDGSTKYVDSNRAGNANGQDDFSAGVYALGITANEFLIGSGGGVSGATHLLENYTRANTRSLSSWSASPGYIGISRNASANYDRITGGTLSTVADASDGNRSGNYYMYARNNAGTAEGFSTARQRFYHIGPNLNGAGELAELDAALTEWKNALASA